MLIELVNLLLAFSESIGYWGVLLLMTIESYFIPFPSEVVVPPAAYLASQGEFNIYLVILAGIGGSLIGALINYFLARTLGRKIVYTLVNKRLAKMLLLSEEKLIRAEEYFRKYGGISTFIGRLIPAIRQLISIPAGFSRMKMHRFLFYTFLGSGLWTVILAIVGYTFGANQELFFQYYDDFKHVIYGVFGLLIIVGLFFWARGVLRSRARNSKVQNSDSK